MVNDTACQKQKATNQKYKTEVSEANLQFFTKKIFYHLSMVEYSFLN